MEFDLEYKLQEFRKEQHEIFDEDGKRYGATPISNNTGERMLQLIDELECALAKAETELRQLTIPDVSNRRELLIAYEESTRMRLFDDVGEDVEEYVDAYLSNL